MKKLKGIARLSPSISRPSSRAGSWEILVAALMLCAPAMAGFQDPATPAAGRLAIEVSDLSGFVASSSAVQVRENDSGGARLRLRNLGMRTAEVPTTTIAYGFSETNSLEAELRYFAVSGTRFLANASDFNGATIAGEQTVHANPLWYSIGVFYQHRWTPPWAADGDVRGLAGVRYTFLDFRIDGGHAPVTPGSVGTETKEDFYLQELPVPTIGLQVHRRLSRQAVGAVSLVGGWLDHVNSGRKEGGTVFLSQREMEAHVQVRLADSAWFRSLHPMIGVFFFDFRQREESREDGNVIQMRMWGPELGVEAQF